MIGLIILCISLVIGYWAMRHGANRARRDNFSEADFQIQTTKKIIYIVEDLLELIN